MSLWRLDVCEHASKSSVFKLPQDALKNQSACTVETEGYLQRTERKNRKVSHKDLMVFDVFPWQFKMLYRRVLVFVFTCALAVMWNSSLQNHVIRKHSFACTLKLFYNMWIAILHNIAYFNCMHFLWNGQLLITNGHGVCWFIWKIGLFAWSVFVLCVFCIEPSLTSVTKITKTGQKGSSFVMVLQAVSEL